MSKWVLKVSFIFTGLGFIAAGIFAPEAWPAGVEMVFGALGALITFMGGWFRRPAPPE